MQKIRIYELAKRLSVANKEVLDVLSQLGIEGKTHSSPIQKDEAELVIEVFARKYSASQITPPSAELVKKSAIAITQLRYEINNILLKHGYKALFEASNETELCSSQLAHCVVSAEKSFKEWIDMMYKYIYESSGKQDFGRRYKYENDSSVRLHISWLRNDYFHDTEMFPDSDKHRDNVKRVYSNYIGRAYPSANGDWLKVQAEIMNGVIIWLQSLRDRLYNEDLSVLREQHLKAGN